MSWSDPDANPLQDVLDAKALMEEGEFVPVHCPGCAERGMHTKECAQERGEPKFCGVITLVSTDEKVEKVRCKVPDVSHRGPHWKNVEVITCECSAFACHCEKP